MMTTRPVAARRLEQSVPSASLGSRGPSASRTAGAAAVVTAALLWGTTGTASHFRPDEASALSVGAARIVFGGALLLCWAAGRGLLREVVRPIRRRGQVALGAVAVAAYQVCFFAAVNSTGVAVGTVVGIGAAPIFTGLVVRFSGGSEVTRVWLASTAAAVCGCTVLVLGGANAGVRPVGIALALGAGAAYAAYAVISARLIADGAASTGVMAALFGGAGLLLLPLLIVTGPGWLLGVRGGLVALHLAVITTFAAYMFYGFGLRSVPVATASTLSLAEPGAAALLGLLLLNEEAGVSTFVGLGLLLLALLLLTVRRSDSSPR